MKQEVYGRIDFSLSKPLKVKSQNFYKRFFKNVLLYMNGRLSKIRSIHTYVIPRTVYFDWICITLFYCEVLLKEQLRLFLLIRQIIWSLYFFQFHEQLICYVKQLTTKHSLSASLSSLLTESRSSSEVGVVAEAPPRIELSSWAIILVKLEVRLFFFLTARLSLGVLKWMAGGALGVFEPEEELGMFGTELAVGRLLLGETGVEAMESREGVAVRVWGVPIRSISPENRQAGYFRIMDLCFS